MITVCLSSRVVSISPKVLEDYKDMISDNKADLEACLRSVEDKINRIQTRDSLAINKVPQQTTILKEKETTQIGLDLCVQLSAQLVEFEATQTEDSPALDRLSTRKQVETALIEVKGSIKSLETRLKSHSAFLHSQVDSVATIDASSEPTTSQLSELQQTAKCTSHCIEMVSSARELVGEPSNTFKGITLADDSFSILTVSDLVRASRLNTAPRTRYVGGQISDETVQQLQKFLKPLDTGSQERLSQTRPEHAKYLMASWPTSSSNIRELSARHRPGLRLPHQKSTDSFLQSRNSHPS